jgi:hypothetical protein
MPCTDVGTKASLVSLPGELLTMIARYIIEKETIAGITRTDQEWQNQRALAEAATTSTVSDDCC